MKAPWFVCRRREEASRERVRFRPSYDVGCESIISQFNWDYRRLFDLMPSDDAAKLRATLKRELGYNRQ